MNAFCHAHFPCHQYFSESEEAMYVAPHYNLNIVCFQCSCCAIELHCDWPHCSLFYFFVCLFACLLRHIFEYTRMVLRPPYCLSCLSQILHSPALFFQMQLQVQNTTLNMFSTFSRLLETKCFPG